MLHLKHAASGRFWDAIDALSLDCIDGMGAGLPYTLAADAAVSPITSQGLEHHPQPFCHANDWPVAGLKKNKCMDHDGSMLCIFVQATTPILCDNIQSSQIRFSFSILFLLGFRLLPFLSSSFTFFIFFFLRKLQP